VDEVTTRGLREALSAAYVPREFGHGPYRVAFENVWTRKRYAALTTILASLPVSWRYFVKHRIFAAVGDVKELSNDGDHEIFDAYRQIVEQFPDLPDIESVRHAQAAE
jgi:N-methylhydantoinase B